MNNYLSGKKLKEFLQGFKVIFWDFDGVIKESTSAKTKGYIKLFEKYGHEVQKKVRIHHEANGGISRYVKIPFYYREYVNKDIDEVRLKIELNRYSRLTLEEVINASWVEGVFDYLKNNNQRQDFYIVTGTPTDDMLKICSTLNIKHFFRGIEGSPLEKDKIVKKNLGEKYYNGKKILIKNFLFIGDALADLEAANKNQISFLLRETEENKNLFNTYYGNRVVNFL